ncbi:MAG: Rne/Rng family ribonuclease, partial [Actinobacteria bacterium]|nr:Rne/Rng family ribonuclease [Actinomycetota bacterium]
MPSEAPAEESDAEKLARKRRRGTRGGRNRKRPATAAAGAEAAAETPADGEKPAPKRRAKAEPKGDRRGERAGRQQQQRRRPAPRRAPLPAAKRELVISVDVGEQRVAVLEDDRVAEVYLERPDRRSIAGNIYLGTVDNVLPGMEAAFVEIGLEKNGFLYVDEIVVPELEGRRHGKRIQDLIARGQQILVQAVKDPMKTKGARLTTDISLPGRFLVYVPNGEGLGVSRRLDDAERARLKDIIKALDVKQGGVIVRTAAEGASAEDVERDLVFLQRLWKTIQAKAKSSKAPALVYEEAELPLRIVRDLFAGDFERALVDNDRTHKRIVSYLKKTSPHMIDRVLRYKEPEPLFEALGVDAEIRSTLSRRVDLPSGGYLVFDYAEAFTVIDVNTGRFVGSRSKTSTGRLEDTITKNNLEAVKEVVRQLRLRDVGGIIVIDFIDMANPKNREAVEEALRTELERDRTKTYVVEISPLGLVEMTRQNVTDGPREILTKKCATCDGSGIVYSEASAAIDVERRLRALVAGSRSQAFRVEVNPKVAALLVGPGASRLAELETLTKRRFFPVGVEGAHLDHCAVSAEGKLADLAPGAPVAEETQVEVKLVEVGLHDATAAVGKLDGYDVIVAGAAKLVGKKATVSIVRVLDGGAYATLVGGPAGGVPVTFEGEAEKPTRAPGKKKAVEAPMEDVAAELEEAEEVEEPVEPEEPAEAGEIEAEAAEEVAEDGTAAAPKRKTRRGTRGGRGRKKKPAVDGGESAGAEPTPEPEPAEVPPAAPADGRRPRQPRIHVPATHLGEPGEAPLAEPSGNGDAPAAGDE